MCKMVNLSSLVAKLQMKKCENAIDRNGTAVLSSRLNKEACVCLNAASNM